MTFSIYTCSLPKQYTNEQLAQGMYEIFKAYGTIISLKASRDDKGRPFGFIQYPVISFQKILRIICLDKTRGIIGHKKFPTSENIREENKNRKCKVPKKDVYSN